MQLNEFQQSTREKLEALLRRKGLAGQFGSGGGPSEFALTLVVSGFESWIYPDGAGILGAEVDERFEIYDYDSLDALQAAYLHSFDRLLGPDLAGSSP